MKRILTLLSVAMMLAGCASFHQARQPKVHHVVLCWLKESGNAGQCRRIIEASTSFKSLPGVLDVRVGKPVESDRPMVDDSFDVAVSMIFRDRQSYAEYQVNPAHLKATRDVLQPLVRKIVIYDFEEAGTEQGPSGAPPR